MRRPCASKAVLAATSTYDPFVSGVALAVKSVPVLPAVTAPTVTNRCASISDQSMPLSVLFPRSAVHSPQLHWLPSSPIQRTPQKPNQRVSQPLFVGRVKRVIRRQELRIGRVRQQVLQPIDQHFHRARHKLPRRLVPHLIVTRSPGKQRSHQIL